MARLRVELTALTMSHGAAKINPGRSLSDSFGRLADVHRRWPMFYGRVAVNLAVKIRPGEPLLQPVGCLVLQAWRDAGIGA
jgi:hypothetical protein